MSHNPMALTVIGNSQKPPLKKKELLRATALAMYNKQMEAVNKARATVSKIETERNRILIKEARKLLSSAKIEVESPWSVDGYTVKFKVTLPRSLGAEYDKQIKAVVVPRAQPFKEILTALEAAAAPGDRVQALVANAALAAKLVEAGNALLNRNALPV